MAKNSIKNGLMSYFGSQICSNPIVFSPTKRLSKTLIWLNWIFLFRIIRSPILQGRQALFMCLIEENYQRNEFKHIFGKLAKYSLHNPLLLQWKVLNFLKNDFLISLSIETTQFPEMFIKMYSWNFSEISNANQLLPEPLLPKIKLFRELAFIIPIVYFGKKPLFT